MRIKSLAQGEKILMLGFEPSTFCIQNQHSNHYTNVQRKAIKLVSPVSHLSYLSRLARLNRPTLSYRRARDHTIEVLKTTSNIYDPKVTKFFTYRDNTVTRGSQIKNIYQVFCRCSIRENKFQPHMQSLEFAASGCGRSKQFEYH